MLQEWKPDFFTRLYVYSLSLMVYAAGDVSWLYAIPRQPLYLLVFALSIVKATRSGMFSSPKKIIWIFTWFVFNVIIICVFRGTLVSQLFRLLFFSIMTSVILLSLDEMKYLLKVLTICFVVILVISIPPWILYLTGVPLPHTGPHYHENGYHVYYDYYYFTTQVNLTSSGYFR